MKVLVTGGTGFVGSHLVRLLLEKQCQVRALVRATSPMDNLRGLDVELVTGDLSDPDSLGKAVAGCQRVFHCAADYRLWAKNVLDIYDTNVKGTASLLKACRHAGVERTVVTSSVAAVGIPASGEGNEDTPVGLENMIGHYKRSKYLAEQEAWLAAQSGDPVVIVNPSTPIGERDIKPTATGKIITDYLNGKMPAFVQTGLNLVDVRDVALGHWLAAEKGQVKRRYILGGQNMTLQEILNELSAISGFAAPKVQLPWWFAYMVGSIDTFVCDTLLGRAPNVPVEGVKMARKHMYFSSQRAQEELGYHPGPVRPALERAVRWFVDNGYCHRKLRK